MFPSFPHNTKNKMGKGELKRNIFPWISMRALNPFHHPFEGMGPCLLTIILCCNELGSRAIRQSYLINRALLRNLSSNVTVETNKAHVASLLSSSPSSSSTLLQQTFHQRRRWDHINGFLLYRYQAVCKVGLVERGQIFFEECCSAKDWEHVGVNLVS